MILKLTIKIILILLKTKAFDICENKKKYISETSTSCRLKLSQQKQNSLEYTITSTQRSPVSDDFYAFFQSIIRQGLGIQLAHGDFGGAEHRGRVVETSLLDLAGHQFGPRYLETCVALSIYDNEKLLKKKKKMNTYLGFERSAVSHDVVFIFTEG